MPEASDPRIQPGAGRAWWHLSRTGLFFGAAYFLTSMAPSLLPRTWYYQGLISGLCAVAGYALGVLVAWVVRSVARLIDLRVTVSGEARHWLLVAAPVFGAVAVLGLTVANVRSQARTAAVRRGSTPLDPFDWAHGARAGGPRRRPLPRRRAGPARARRTSSPRRRATCCPRRSRPSSPSSSWPWRRRGSPTASLFHRGMQAFAGIAAQVNTTRRPAAPRRPRRCAPGGPGRSSRWDSLGYQGQMFVTSAPTRGADHGGHRTAAPSSRSGSTPGAPPTARSPTSPMPSSPSSSAPRRSTAGCSRSSRRRAPAGSTTGRPSRSSTSATATARSPRCSTPTCRARCR